MSRALVVFLLYATKEVITPRLSYGRGSEPHSEPRA